MSISYLIAFIMAAMGAPHATSDVSRGIDPNGGANASAVAGGGDRGAAIDPWGGPAR